MGRADDERWMRRCFELARRGAGAVSPNPMVGAIVVQKGKIAGRGYHKTFGGPHAEVNAINDALLRREDIRGATLFVNLEPCAHHGKTPPCAKAIINHGISKVVCAIEDPNPRVAGEGFRMLRNAGVRVVTGSLREEATRLNEKFLRHITTGLPFVAIKAAQTSDEFIARTNGSSRWITSRKSRVLVHRLRSEYDAVLIGAGTAIADNPSLTVRHVSGRNPIRVLLDAKLRTPFDSTMFSDRFRRRTIVFIGRGAIGRAAGLRRRGVQVVALGEKNGLIPVGRILSELGRRGIASVLVEGGQKVFEEFLKEQAAEKLHLFTSPKLFRDGLSTFGDAKSSFSIDRKLVSWVGKDRYIEGYISYRKDD